MRQLTCDHCNGNVVVEDTDCPNCGMPLPPNHGERIQKRFTLWFIAIALFCVFMMIWLPPIWK